MPRRLKQSRIARVKTLAVASFALLRRLARSPRAWATLAAMIALVTVAIIWPAMTILCTGILSALVWTSFPVHYWVTTRGRCFRSPHGRNIWAMAAVLALLIDVSLASSLTRRPTFDQAIAQNPVWLVWIAALLWPALATVGLHRHWLLWRDQHHA